MEKSSPVMFEIKITRNLAFFISTAIISAVCLGTLLFFQNNVNASSYYPNSQSLSEVRSFYLTTGAFDGNGVDESNVCAAGYHLASLWEILDVSNLVYASGLGAGGDDIGGGPPASQAGWVRTGYTVNNSSIAGRANCSAWSSTAGFGTTVELSSDWTNPEAMDISSWNVNVHSCTLTRPAWCVQD